MSMELESEAIRCTPAELAFAASLLGVDSLLGVPQPGLTGQQSEALWQEALASLRTRHLVEVSATGDVRVGDEFSDMVVACGMPDMTVMVSYTPAAGGASVWYLHISDRIAVQLCIEDGICVLTRVPQAALTEHILQLLRASGRALVNYPAGMLPDSQHLARFRTVVVEHGTEQAAAELEAAGLHPETSRALALTLATPVGNGALVAMHPDEVKWEVDGFGTLEGENGQWLLRNISGPHGAQIEVTACSADYIRQEIVRLMSGMPAGKAVLP